MTTASPLMYQRLRDDMDVFDKELAAWLRWSHSLESRFKETREIHSSVIQNFADVRNFVRTSYQRNSLTVKQAEITASTIRVAYVRMSNINKKIGAK